jgi:hypothetical protein
MDQAFREILQKAGIADPRVIASTIPIRS